MTPLREPTFLILAALAGEPLHGYAIIAAAHELSDGAVRLQAGTLYAALDRLTTEGLVEVDGEEVVNGRLRRSYRLTGPGRTALTMEAEHRRTVASRTLRRLRAAEAGA